jgi:hypothetical protein
MRCFLYRPLFDFPKISAALCLAALTLYSSEESRGITKSCRGLFKILSRHCLVLAECFLGGTEPDRRMSRYLQAAGGARNWRVTAVLTCPLRSVTETGDLLVPYCTLQHTCMNHCTCYPKPGLRSLVCGADKFGKMWSANDQHEIEQTE